MESLADRIRIRLAELNQTPADLIRARVLSKAGVYNVLSGTTSAANIKASTLDKFARALRVNREWLASGKGPKDQTDAGDSEGAFASGGPESPSDKASHAALLDDDKLDRSIQFLERQFALWDREFIASQNSHLLAGVYRRIGRRGETNLVELSQWLTQQIEGESTDVGSGGVRRAG